MAPDGVRQADGGYAFRMDRDLAEHLAADTGLRPEEIAPDITPASADPVAKHLAADTGVDEAEITKAGADVAAEVIARLPVD